MKIYGHPWSINTRKVQLALAEKVQAADLVLVRLPKGEQRSPQHVALHPFAKVPVLDDEGFVVYEVDAINRYLEHKFPAPSLIPAGARAAARMTQWISVANSYFVPHAGPFLLETLFRRYLGGEPDQRLIESAPARMQPALDAADRALETHAYLAGDAFSLADINWLPYLEYLEQTGQAGLLSERKNLSAWWERVSRRPTWQKVARSGPQPYEPGMLAEVIEAQYR